MGRTGPKSLQLRLALFVLLPVALVLAGVGAIGFIYARDQLLNQWGEATVLKLQRTAHQVDMRLSRPKAVMLMVQRLRSLHDVRHASDIIIKELETIEGVDRVELKITGKPVQGSRPVEEDHTPRMAGSHGVMMAPWQRFVAVTPPEFDTSLDAKSVSLLVDIKDARDKVIGHIRVVLRFDTLVAAIEATDWWQNHRAYLIDDSGRVLSQAGLKGGVATQVPQLDDEIITAIQDQSQGTVVGDELPPPVVTGFYRLQEAPWTLVIQAPGSDVLAPILRFRLWFFVFGAAVIAGILLLIRSVTTGTVRSIRSVSTAAKAIAQGDYAIELPRAGKDEVGELINNFSTMVVQLEERARLKNSLNLAMEVQQQLLPQRSFCIGDLCIAGVCEYCDETGGDYYDFLDPELMADGRVGIAVGDVSGHGVAAALLMTTARALVRSQVVQSNRIDSAITHVNRLLIKDTEKNGNFVTLFMAAFDMSAHTIEWVRAGHDPALLYDPDSDRITELGGEGIALGLTDDWTYKRMRYEDWKPGQIVLICTDGVWETENPNGEQFGKARLRNVLRRFGRKATAEKIVATIHEEIRRFRGDVSPSDDATLVAVRWRPAPEI